MPFLYPSTWLPFELGWLVIAISVSLALNYVLLYLVSDVEDERGCESYDAALYGMCYLLVFPDHMKKAAETRLMAFPEFGDFLSVVKEFGLSLENFHFEFVDGAYHVLPGAGASSFRKDCSQEEAAKRILRDFVGTTNYASTPAGKRYARDFGNKAQEQNVVIPTRSVDQVCRNADQVVSTIRRDLPSHESRDTRLAHSIGVVQANHTGERYQLGTKIKTVSAMASSRLLLGSDSLQGEYADNVVAVKETFSGRTVTTSLNPTSKQYRKLVEALRIPLQYNPRVKEHDAAGTCRRAWADEMQSRTMYGRVGMISPSILEWHMNPNACAYYFNGGEGGVDPSRLNKSCNICKARRCRVYEQAKVESRVVDNLSSACLLFKAYQVDYLWMINIEPNISSSDILYLMNKAGIENGYSATSIDWNSVHSDKSYCDFIAQETTREGTKVISKFSDSGSYVQEYSKVKQMFAPCFESGSALRRTVVGRAGISMLIELNVDHGGLGTSFVPDRWNYYLIPVPHPTKGVIHLKVERKGFDRVLQLFRTTVNRNVDAARIQLRQSNVTYSVSGTQLTPRLEIDASNYELLALWMVSYSTIMDTMVMYGEESIASREASILTEGSLKKVAGSLYSAITHKLLSNSDSLNPNFGSNSSVRRWLRVCEADGRFLTLEEISDRAYQECFGLTFVAERGFNFLNAKYGALFHKVPGVYSAIRYANNFSKTIWRDGFEVVDIVVRACILTGKVTDETIGFICDVAIHMARILGVDHKPLLRMRGWIESMDVPIGEFWKDVNEAQALDFQVASIKIVESLVNNFSPDPKGMKVIHKAISHEGDSLESDWNKESPFSLSDSEIEKEIDKEMEEIPYTRFLSELKIFLSKFNSRAARISQMNNLLCHASSRRHELPVDVQKNIDRLIIGAKDVLSEVNTSVEQSDNRPQASVYAITQRAPNMTPLPIPAVDIVDDQFNVVKTTSSLEAFKQYSTVDLDTENVVDEHRFLRRLRWSDDKPDFGIIHDDMAENFPEFMTEQSVTQCPNLPDGAQGVYSPDSIGAKFLEKIVARAAYQSLGMQTRRCKAPFATTTEIHDWVSSRSKTDIGPVSKAIMNAEKRLGNKPLPYLLHIDGLAMGGKSKGVRSWISDKDVVVVPSNKLKKSWIKELGELEPLKRASVYTQHMALNQNCSRYVIVDECYTFETPHLELLRRFPNALGFITIGDAQQIRDVFAEGTSTFDPTLYRPFFTAIAPVTFCPWDVSLQYLRNNRSSIFNKVYYCGSQRPIGLYYDVEESEIVLTGKEDLTVNALQGTKSMMTALGAVDPITVHESQGSRSERTYIHLTRPGQDCPDMAFLAMNPRHFGVAITRARVATCFVCKDKASLASIPFVDKGQVNGKPLPSDVLYAGTTFDLVDPICQEDIVFERFENENVSPEGCDIIHADARYTVGSFINEEDQEALPRESINSDVDVSCATIVNTYVPRHEGTTNESMLFNPASVPGAGLINMIERRTKPTVIQDKHFRVAEKIVKLIFDQVVDPFKFMKLASDTKSSLKAQTRAQVMKMADSCQDKRADSVSFAFPKNEPAKKVMTLGKGLKILSVTAMNQTQLQLFGDAAAILTHAWSRSLRPGIISPVGHTKPEVARVLGSFTHSWEIDLEKQDSTHSATHVAVFLLFMGMVAKRQGMTELAQEIRQARVIGDMQGTMRIEMGTGLGSGDIWTLIANKIMAFSTLVSLYEIPPVKRMLQVGDDITCDRKFKLRKKPLSGSEGVTLKIIDNTLTAGRPSFTSNVSISPDMSIAARVRGILKMAFSQRSRSQHISYLVECDMLKKTLATVGMGEYTGIFQDLFGAEPGFTEFILHEAMRYSQMDFDDIPDALKLHSADDKKCVVNSRDSGCFGFALAHVVADNVQALNALSTYSGPVAKSVAIQACIDNSVEYLSLRGNFYKGRIESCVDHFLDRRKGSGVVYIFDDHAISITSVSNDTITFGGTHRYRINLVTNSVEELDFL